MALRLATPLVATTPLGRGTRHQVQCIGASCGRACRSAIPRSSRAWIFMKAHSDSYDIHISGRFGPSRFFMTFGPILRLRSVRPMLLWDGVMLSDPKHEDRLDRLTEQLRLAPALTRDLISNVIADACIRFPVLHRAGKAARIDRLIEAGAWSDAVLALIELELPAWKLRRLVYEDGEWFCSLSKQPNLPVAFDDTADARH